MELFLLWRKDRSILELFDLEERMMLNARNNWPIGMEEKCYLTLVTLKEQIIYCVMHGFIFLGGELFNEMLCN